MAGDILGNIFQVVNFGESHGKAIGAVVLGCPSGLSLSVKDIQIDLDRRRPGQSEITTPRAEPDSVEILSGVYDGLTLGTPISLLIYNKTMKSQDYDNVKAALRPSHGDYAYMQKYGHYDHRGGGRFSARITAPSVAAGAIAKKILKERHGIEIIVYVKSIKDISVEVDKDKITKDKVESNIVRCPDDKIAEKMIKLIKNAEAKGDSVGGVIECVIRHVPAGLGEPVFDSLKADLGKAMLSINGCMGFSIGSGFESASMFGSKHNDLFYLKSGKVRTKTNNAGGILAGISTGENIYFSVPFKPVSTIMQAQKTVTKDLSSEANLLPKGRHDICILPRAVPIVEAMAALVLCDHSLRYFGSRSIKMTDIK